MNEHLQALQAIIDNPDDLSALPGVLTGLQEYHTNVTTRETADLERITNLQNANRNLLGQIPIHTGEPATPPATTEVTFEDAQAQLVNAMQNIGGN